MVQMGQSDGDAYDGVHNLGAGSGIWLAVRTLSMLALWVAAFVAFLVAPLIVLGVAWLLGLMWLAARHRTPAPRAAATVGPAGDSVVTQPHRFGGARDAGETR